MFPLTTALADDGGPHLTFAQATAAACRVPPAGCRLLGVACRIQIQIQIQTAGGSRCFVLVWALATISSFRNQATLHLDALVPGARTVGVSSKFSMFIYRAAQIMKKDGARLKTVSWRRVPDLCIPARAKVNGAYVNSALAKQEALSCGCVMGVCL